MYIKVECLCGKVLKLNECKSKKCRCGIVISITSDDGYFIPIATSRGSGLEELIKRGKKVLNTYPVIVEYMDDEDVYSVDQLEVIE